MLAESAARLATMRRWVTAEHAVSERIGVEMGALRRFETSEELYFDRLHQELDVLLGSIDAAANAMGMLIDLQLNERAYVVGVVATIFVPLTFITGFFGMNFGWMVDNIDSLIAFWLLAIVLPLATAPRVLAPGRSPLSRRRRRLSTGSHQARLGASSPSRRARLTASLRLWASSLA